MASLDSTRELGKTFTVGDLKYTVTLTNPAEVAVAGRADGSIATDITIPKEVLDGGTTYSVTSIGNNAFKRIGIESIAIPHSVKTIGAEAFLQSGIPSIAIPHSVTSIGARAFYQCTKLAKVEIENTDGAESQLETIGEFAFFQSVITSIDIPHSVTSIGNHAFYQCTKLAKVEIENTDGAKSQLATIGEGAFRESGIPSIAIPHSVTSIGVGAFNSCRQLAEVTIENKETLPSKLATIGGGAFAWSGITSIAIPHSVTSIGVWAFGGCTKLAEVTIENTDGAKSQLATIGASAFFQSGIPSIAIPHSVTSIGRDAFLECTKLAEVTIENTETLPSKLATIGEGAFRESGIPSIAIPHSVTSIGRDAFLECTKLAEVTIENTDGAKSQLATIGEYAFSDSVIPSIAIPQSVTSIGVCAFEGCTELAKVTIENTETLPSQLATIGEYAFFQSGITSIAIPQSVKTIGDWAFAYCSELSTIVFSSAAVPTFGSGLFYGAEKDITAYVPFAQKADYKAAFGAGMVLAGYTKTLTVLGYGALVLPENTLENAQINEEGYSQSVAATGGIENEVVTYEIKTGDGALPDGLTLNTDGTITGTPTKVGTATFTVTAKVSNKEATFENSATKEYTIKIEDTVNPELTVENAEVTIELNGNITEEEFLKLVGVTTTDNSDADVTTRINNAGVTITTDFANVKQNVLGKTTVTITATDASGNISTATITVNVTDTTPEPTTEEPTTVTEETTTGTGTDVKTGDTFVTPLFFVVALFSAVGILVSRKRKEELQG